MKRIILTLLIFISTISISISQISNKDFIDMTLKIISYKQVHDNLSYFTKVDINSVYKNHLFVEVTRDMGFKEHTTVIDSLNICFSIKEELFFNAVNYWFKMTSIKSKNNRISYHFCTSSYHNGSLKFIEGKALFIKNDDGLTLKKISIDNARKK